MNNQISKLDKIIKSENTDPALKIQAEKKKQSLINNKPVKK